MGAKYKDYKPGLNSKGFKLKSYEESHPKPTSGRGKRRRQRLNGDTVINSNEGMPPATSDS